MLVPIYLGLCPAGELDAGHRAAATLMARNVGTAGLVSLVHTRHGHRRRCDRLMRPRMARPDVPVPQLVQPRLAWAASLILIGVIALVTA